MIYPITGDDGHLCYRTLAQAVKHGAFVTEVDEHGDVNEVLVSNASDQAVLLYEGELILGARQDRTIDQPVLVPVGVELRIPVSCIEQGRWDHRRRTHLFSPAASAADPGLRRAKRADANRVAPRGRPERPSQHAIWSEVDERLALHAVPSRSSALTDIYDAKRPALDELRSEIELVEDQLGVVVELAGRPVALDLVSRQEVFADLLPRLADGYALLAISALTPRQADASDSAALMFFEKTLSSRRRWLPTAGMGDAFALTCRSIQGCGLGATGELVALSAFPANGR